MSRIFERSIGDVLDWIDVDILGFVDLTTVTSVTTKVWRRYWPEQILEATVTNPAESIIRVDLSTDGWLTNQTHIGDWKMKHRLTFGNGSEISVPAGRADVLRLGYGTGT